MILNRKLIEEYRHSNQGYNPYLIGPKWQVAQLNYQPDLAPGAIKKIDVHHHTNETFLLMDGQAVLIAAEILQNRIGFEVINMKPKVVYNIPKAEDTNTHLGDYDYHYLNKEEQKELCELIVAVWKY
jgi:hypothetical protein